mmetsp:Transcript_30688/g.43551  ORF Transcript_30688/g.43551 Transcript_30688/m.43551 type:complete len:290 (+) Transcript_30688:371-1240(+)
MKGKKFNPVSFFPCTYRRLYQTGAMTFSRATMEDLDPASSPCGMPSLDPSATSAAPMVSICVDERKPRREPTTAPRNWNSIAPRGTNMDDDVAITMTVLRPIFRTSRLPTRLPRIPITPNIAIKAAYLPASRSHSALAYTWNTSPMEEGIVLMRRRMTMTLSSLCRNNNLRLAKGEGNLVTGFVGFSRDCLPICRVSPIMVEAMIKATEKIQDATMYGTLRPLSTSCPAPIEPQRKPREVRDSWIPMKALSCFGCADVKSLKMACVVKKKIPMKNAENILAREINGTLE